AAQARNDAERAAVVAAFRDLEVGDVARRRQRAGGEGVERAARRIEMREAPRFARKHMARGMHDFAPLAGAEHGVDLRELREQRRAGALSEAAGDDQSAETSRLLELR